MKITKNKTFWLTPEQHRNKVCKTIRVLLKNKKKVINSETFNNLDAIHWYNPMIIHVIKAHKEYVKQYNKSKSVTNID